MRFSRITLLLGSLCLMAGTLNAQTGTQPAAFGPFRVYDSDSNSVRIGFSAQMRLDFESRDQGGTAARTEKLLGYFRTVRPVLRGNFPKHNLGFLLQINTLPGALELLDMYFDWKASRHVQFRFGQFKTPFTRYRNQSRLRLTFVDWPIVSPYFGAERQLGFSLHNGFDSPPEYEYAFGVFSGKDARASHGIGIAKVYDIDLSNPSDLTGETVKTEFNPELFVRLAYNHGGIDVSSDTDSERGPLRYSVGINGAWDLEAGRYTDFSWRIAPELLAKYEGWSLGLVGYAGGSRVGERAEVKTAMIGLLARLTYRIDSRWEVSSRFAVVHLRNDLIRDIGETQGLVNETPFAIQDHSELSLGVNRYLVDHRLKLQVTVDWQRYLDDRTDLFVQTQFQLVI
ncbi:MAG: porin [Candidatus Zixiibacteriota bacterium]